MATIGLPLLARSLEEFKLENSDHTIDIIGIVFNHSSTYSDGPEGRDSIEDVIQEAKSKHWPVFDNHIRYSASYAKSAREGTPIRHTSYARYEVINEFDRFKDEFFRAIHLK